MEGNLVPVSASGGWVDDDTLRVEAIFLESPHRVDITSSLSEGTATVTWRTEPLAGGALETLHRPR